MKKIQSKKHKLGTYEVDKISLSYFDDKRCQMMEFIFWLILIKKVSQTVKRLKKVVMIEKHYNEKIMIM